MLDGALCMALNWSDIVKLRILKLTVGEAVGGYTTQSQQYKRRLRPTALFSGCKFQEPRNFHTAIPAHHAAHNTLDELKLRPPD
ncbi:hypothetical protein BOTNAR_0326g00080 [Botryotinia narcissicola]|uniref:Uncharacterized protein n=1 Tax=Botryotinia narcissicola TaxID=278944 RepID=A0A4Z1HTY2_9HELO|nr:hypothetical protein BOTNAR_0326g00080 [Botryotinia narcissicola]